MAVNNIISLMGPPCSGKGTLTNLCKKDRTFEIFSAGNFCRKSIEIGTDIGNLILKYSQNKSLIPDDLIVDVVSDWFLAKISKKNIETKTIIFDGFPRTAKQATLFLDFLNKIGVNFNFKIIYLIISDEEVLKRAFSRLLCQNKDCQIVYSENFLKNKSCEVCGSDLIKRADDSFENIKNRLKKFIESSKKVLNFYASSNIRVEKIEVTNLKSLDLFENFKSKLIL
ncbi:nucleoside monophosphate kinase [Candidatus Babeliales bacterium]|nr:nucleoside monophosphate kinase [Candidatus Babeliales bacterium]